MNHVQVPVPSKINNFFQPLLQCCMYPLSAFFMTLYILKWALKQMVAVFMNRAW